MEYLHFFETTSEFNEAYNGLDYKEPWVSFTEENSQVKLNTKITGITINNLTWETDVDAKGGTANKNNCSYTVVAHYDNSSSADVTSTATVSGELMVPSSKDITRHSAGTLTLVAKYGEFTSPSAQVTVYQEAAHDYSRDYFTIKALTNTTFTFGRRAAELPKYRINGEEWIEAGGSGIQGLTLNTNDEIEFSWAPDVSSNPNIYTSIFTISGGQYEFFGNIFSLMYGDNFIGETSFVNTAITFTSMFNGCTGLTSAENLILPATTLNTSSYNMMFQGCSGLTTAPELPATTLASNCYQSMFQGCTSLTTAPELPSITLATDCYKNMFGVCISLAIAPVLPATTMAQTCYSNMFYYCQSLTSAPELPATTLYNGCYMSMFNYCVNLNYVKCLATSGMGTHTSNWLQGVANTGTFVKDANATWQTGTTSGVPNGWTVEDAE